MQPDFRDRRRLARLGRPFPSNAILKLHRKTSALQTPSPARVRAALYIMLLSLQRLALGKIRFDTPLAPADIQFNEHQVTLDAPVHMQGEAELRDAITGEIRIRGQLRGALTSQCDRCLEPISLPVDARFDLLYEPADAAPEAEEASLSSSDTEVGYYDQDGLNLADVVREQLLLALPMQRLCKPDCKGICPVCGTNRNQAACSCTTGSTDERWAALKNL